MLTILGFGVVVVVSVAVVVLFVVAVTGEAPASTSDRRDWDEDIQRQKIHTRANEVVEMRLAAAQRLTQTPAPRRAVRSMPASRPDTVMPYVDTAIYAATSNYDCTPASYDGGAGSCDAGGGCDGGGGGCD